MATPTKDFNKWYNYVLDVAEKAVTKAGYELLDCRRGGRSVIWRARSPEGQEMRFAVRSSRDGWFAFSPREKNGELHWTTLDDVDAVLLCATDDRDNPQNLNVYIFPKEETVRHFNASYAARKQAGHTVTSNGFSLWVHIDEVPSGKGDSPIYVGAGLGAKFPPIDSEPLAVVYDPEPHPPEPEPPVPASQVTPEPSATTIADVLDQARKRIAELSGMPLESVKIDLRLG